jgi:regulator of sirC expression with transglutaminase-like and TPR domain
VRNSYVHEVLQTRHGIPITLALLYIELAQHAGLTARGVSFPGHFLVKLKMPRGEVVIDPFNGMSLSREELDERLGPTASGAVWSVTLTCPSVCSFRPRPRGTSWRACCAT